MAEGDLERLLGSDEEIEKIVAEASHRPGIEEIINQAKGPQAAPTTDGHSVSGAVIEVGGVLRDKQGNTWQVPVGNVEDIGDLYAGEVYKYPRGYCGTLDYKPRPGSDDPGIDEMLFVQMIPLNRLREYVVRRFVPVTLTEMGIPEELANTSGSPLDRYHVVGDAVLIKIPLVLAKAIQQRKDDETLRRLAEVQPTEEMLKQAKKSGIVTKVEVKRAFDKANPTNRQGVYANEEVV